MTSDQFSFLYEQYQKKQTVDSEFLAAIHGIDLSKEKKKTGKSSGWGDVGLFGDPNDYSHLSKDEREKLTQTMLAKMQIWAANKSK